MTLFLVMTKEMHNFRSLLSVASTRAKAEEIIASLRRESTKGNDPYYIDTDSNHDVEVGGKIYVVVRYMKPEDLFVYGGLIFTDRAYAERQVYGHDYVDVKTVE